MSENPISYHPISQSNCVFQNYHPLPSIHTASQFQFQFNTDPVGSNNSNIQEIKFKWINFQSFCSKAKTLSAVVTCRGVSGDWNIHTFTSMYIFVTYKCVKLLYIIVYIVWYFTIWSIICGPITWFISKTHFLHQVPFGIINDMPSETVYICSLLCLIIAVWTCSLLTVEKRTVP